MLDITKLIEVAEEVVSDPQVGFASEITRQVQEISYDQDVYVLSVVLTNKTVMEQRQRKMTRYKGTD
ncbi:hypothetical protein EXU57_24355 [Segetibacter sp. 3557_3]|uniref:hypothetical protein n=1 Tax=Segetibacter sp. 3557_3 TaxID=2547429 RepID=UPI0010591F1F|nr:hypothetical protein [Segetibacter sp. 3557_3]TDH18184.1 hypothetical protein EXU57_24355 [Segetibacter sp. 3557_3]